MSCEHFEATSCGPGCGGCAHFLKSTSIAVVGGTLRITLPRETVCNKERICICLAQPIPGTVTPNMVVTVLIGTVPFNIINKSGNFMYADQLRSRKVLRTTVGIDTSSLVLTCGNNLCPTAHVFTCAGTPVSKEVPK